MEATQSVRDAVAEVLEQVARDGLDHSRHLDSALDAIFETLRGAGREHAERYPEGSHDRKVATDAINAALGDE